MKVLNTTTLTEAQARGHRIISQNIKYGRLRMMATESLVMYNVATSKIILAQELRETFNQGLRHDQDYSLVRIDIRSPVRPTGVVAARDVLLRMTAEPTPKAG